MDQNPSPSKADRKTIEKNRRNQMKDLYSKLNSLVPSPSAREAVSLPDQLEVATNYIKKLEAELEKMKKKKECLVMGNRTSSNKYSSSRSSSSNINNSGSGPVNLPSVDVRVLGSALEVVVVTGLNCQFLFGEIIRLLHDEEGAEVVSASFNVLNDTVFHTIHCKIEQPGRDYGATRISERLRKFVFEINS